MTALNPTLADGAPTTFVVVFPDLGLDLLGKVGDQVRRQFLARRKISAPATRAVFQRHVHTVVHVVRSRPMGWFVPFLAPRALGVLVTLAAGKGRGLALRGSLLLFQLGLQPVHFLFEPLRLCLVLLAFALGLAEPLSQLVPLSDQAGQSRRARARARARLRSRMRSRSRSRSRWQCIRWRWEWEGGNGKCVRRKFLGRFFASVDRAGYKGES